MDSILQTNVVAHIFIVVGPIIGLALLVLWRAKSIHSIMERLWLAAAGKGEPQDEKLKQLLQETRDMERFRFLYRIKPRTVADIARFKAWLDENGIGIFEAKQAVRWLDLSKDEILLPPPRRRNIWYFLLATACLLILFAGYLGVTTSHGWFRTNTTKISFLMDKDSVRSPFYPFSELKVPLESCKQGIESLKRAFAFSDSEATALCQAYTDQSLEKDVSGAVRFQVLMGILLMLYAMPPMFFAFARMNSVNVAIGIAKRIGAAKHSPLPQLRS